MFNAPLFIIPTSKLTCSLKPVPLTFSFGISVFLKLSLKDPFNYKNLLIQWLQYRLILKISYNWLQNFSISLDKKEPCFVKKSINFKLLKHLL